MSKPQKQLAPEDEVLRRMLQARPKTHEEMIGTTKPNNAKPPPKKKAAAKKAKG